VLVGGALLVCPLPGEAATHLVEFDLASGVGLGLGGGVFRGLRGGAGVALEGRKGLIHDVLPVPLSQ
jgi:hypothetical protein